MTRYLRVPIIALLALSLSPDIAQADLLGTLKSTLGQSGASLPKSMGTGTTALSQDDIVNGLRDALKVGSERVVARIGVVDGFNADPAIHIPLPPALTTVQSTLKKFGLSALADDVETKLNRGAEAAMPKARDLIVKAITAMTLDDAKGILNGPDNAATEYFKRIAGDQVRADVAPIIDRALADAGAVAAYDQLMGKYAALPFVPNIKADISAHATALAVDGLFYYLAVEEKAIRQNPAKRTTELLSKVFAR